MKTNPVYKKESMVSARSIRTSMTLLVFNGILAVVALLNMYSAVAQVKINAEVQYASFLRLYVFVASIEFVLLMVIMPANTAGSISGERERQTLDLMLTTKMTAADIVLGKLAAAFSAVFTLVLSSFPVLALVFVFGGVTVSSLLMLLLVYFTAALFCGSIGMFFSAWLKKSALSTLATYAVIVFLIAGTYAVNVFAQSMSQMSSYSYAGSISNIAVQANSGNCIYLMLINPISSFYAIINKQAGYGTTAVNVSQWFGSRPETFITENWICFSLGIQIMLIILILFAAIRVLNRSTYNCTAFTLHGKRRFF